TVGHCAPDVMAADDEPFRGLASKGVYEDLTSYVKSDPDFKLHELYPAFPDIFVINRRYYGLTLEANCLMIYYNSGHSLTAWRSTAPKPDWTWDDFNHDAIALTRDLDGDGRIDQFGFNRLSWYYCLEWVWSAGGTDMDPQMTHYTLDTPEA